MDDVAGGWPVYIVATLIALVLAYFYLLQVVALSGFILIFSWL